MRSCPSDMYGLPDPDVGVSVLLADPAKVRGIREDPRMAEQQFGNLQDADLMKKIKNERHLYGR